MSDELTPQEKFLAGREFFGRRLNTHTYMYDGGSVHIRTFGPCSNYAYFCLADKINDEGFTAFVSLLGAKEIRHRFKFDDFIFLDEKPVEQQES
jgi:hypothetical protein